MSEQKINEFFGDAESTGFGTGWWSGILSAFFGFLSFGGVLCLHFPQFLTSAEFRPFYSLHAIRLLIQFLIVAAVAFGVLSSLLRKKKTLALAGMLLAIAATALSRFVDLDVYSDASRVWLIFQALGSLLLGVATPGIWGVAIAREEGFRPEFGGEKCRGPSAPAGGPAQASREAGAVVGAGITLLFRSGPSGRRPIRPVLEMAGRGARMGGMAGLAGARWAGCA